MSSPLTLALALTLTLAAFPALATAGVAPVSPRIGAPGMLEPLTGSLLVTYYETFLRDQDIEHYRQLVSTRYTEATLCRLIEAGSVQARRAAVLALGLFGTYETNASVARGLRDPDLTVRRMAGDALWAIWFRADTAENNKTLEQVSGHISHQRYDQAVELATKLIARAPRFAEAYNQRAFAQYLLRNYEASAADCRRALELNPYHIGALAGLAKCQMRLDLPGEALKTFRRALRLQPYNEDLQETISILEGQCE
jgi:tetratricopeptide (TPR) repeat protein